MLIEEGKERETCQRQPFHEGVGFIIRKKIHHPRSRGSLDKSVAMETGDQVGMGTKAGVDFFITAAIIAPPTVLSSLCSPVEENILVLKILAALP